MADCSYHRISCDSCRIVADLKLRKEKSKGEKEMDESILLETEKICFSYEEGKPVLHDISFQVRKGERIAVVGSNGAGKSTLFLNMNGVLQPDSGSIRYEGEKIEKKDWKTLRRKVGIIFQNADEQMIASTVFSEVAFGPTNMKLPKEEIKTRVRDALLYMNLEGYESRPPHYLSGGEKKRVSIADILAMKPEILIFDEPTAALDPVNIEVLERVMNQLSEEGRTLIVSTHDADFAYRFADRVLVFAEGRVIADGNPETVFRDDNVRKKANLRMPVLMEVAELLKEKGMLGRGIYPKTVDNLREIL